MKRTREFAVNGNSLFRGTYSKDSDPSSTGEIGAWAARVKTLEEIVSANDLAVSQPGSTSHHTHQEHLFGSTINGDGVRGLCGAYSA